MTHDHHALPGASNSASGTPPQMVPLPPLEVSAVCVTKAALIKALRIYVPALVDIEVVEDGERFLLTMAAPVGPVVTDAPE